MRAALIFTATAILLYLLADRLLELIERRVGRRLEQRSVYFFAILLGLALLVFPLMERWLST